MRTKRTRKLTPAQRLRFLHTREAVATLGAAVVSDHLRALRRERKRMELEAPSATWLDAGWDAGQAWPSGWVRCARCGRLTPPVYMTTSGHCQDCRYCTMSAGEWSKIPSSPSGHAIMVAGVMGARLKF